MFAEKGPPIRRSRHEALSTILEIQEAEQVEPLELEVPHTQVGSTQLEVATVERHNSWSRQEGERALQKRPQLKHRLG